MHKKRRNKLEWPIMTVGSEKKDSAMNKISRTELKCATVTVQKERQAYGMHKRAEELGCPIIVRRRKTVKCIKIAQKSSNVQQ